ncbi:MAG TPA: hypothetical protein VKT77_01490, partial [Chthonomonadaceae bacterium]|nr:hypothetical protein [Chthonomonadaceae bacterium]
MAAAVLCTALTGAPPCRAQNGTDDRLLAGAEERIERIRKADFTIVVRTASGNPARDATVEARQTGHAFLFGCAALTLAKHADPAQEALYRQRFGDLFNFATILCYWQDTEPQKGRTDYDLLVRQARALNAMGIRVKAHPLLLAG